MEAGIDAFVRAIEQGAQPPAFLQDAERAGVVTG